MAVRDDTSTPVTDAADRAARRRARKRRSLVRRVAGVSVAAVTLGVAANALAVRGEIVAGVHVAGVDLGGLTRAEARERLADTLRARLRTPVEVRVAGETSRVNPWQAGIRIDVQATVDRAFDVGRVRGSLFPFGGSDDVDPVLALPEGTPLPRGLAKLEREPVDATPAVNAAGKVQVKPSQTGLAIPAKAALETIALAAVAGRPRADVKGDVLQPKVTTEAATEVADEARELLSGPIALTRKGKRIGILTPKEIAPLLAVERVADRYRVRVAPARLRTAISADVAPFQKAPVDASWTTDGRRATLVPARQGIDLLAVPTARQVKLGGTGDGPRRAEIAFGPRDAELTTEIARSWGVKRLVSSVTTDLGDSSENRIHNVGLMAELLDGHVIPPGGRFSFNETVGPRTAERGFLEGQAIVNGLLVPSIGGGVCQVATTVFGAAFYAGLPIEERTNHSFYISHYDVGMDATVAWGGLDLKFTNDTKHAILIRTTSDASTMTVNFYSTPTGVEVTKETGERSAPTQPHDRYILDPALPPTAIQQTSSGVAGFAITVSRTVRRGGKVVRTDSFTSDYVPEDVIYRVGRDARVPAGATVEPPPPTSI